MGETMPQLLDTMRIPHRTLSEPTMMDDLRWVGQTVMKQRIPVALLIKKGIIKGLHP
jgi:sulfopyruvate decarboxylase subunit alpha